MKQNRCKICKKNINIIYDLSCDDCKEIFCFKHRLPEYHNCIFLNERIEREKNKLEKSLEKIFVKKIFNI